jgi:hypothetical protein
VTRLTTPETDAAIEGAWPPPGPRIIFAEQDPEPECAECARLQVELAAAREQIEHLSRLALRARNAQAGR